MTAVPSPAIDPEAIEAGAERLWTAMFGPSWDSNGSPWADADPAEQEQFRSAFRSAFEAAVLVLLAEHERSLAELAVLHAAHVWRAVRRDEVSGMTFHHGLHARCRLVCKFCDVKCLCGCHPSTPDGGGQLELNDLACHCAVACQGQYCRCACHKPSTPDGGVPDLDDHERLEQRERDRKENGYYPELTGCCAECGQPDGEGHTPGCSVPKLHPKGTCPRCGGLDGTHTVRVCVECAQLDGAVARAKELGHQIAPASPVPAAGASEAGQ